MLAGQAAQGGHVVVPVNGGDDDFGLALLDQFGVHHHPGHTSVAVKERVYFTDEEHHIGCLGEGVSQGLVIIEALNQGAFYEQVVNEKRISRPVDRVLI